MRQPTLKRHPSIRRAVITAQRAALQSHTGDDNCPPTRPFLRYHSHVHLNILAFTHSFHCHARNACATSKYNKLVCATHNCVTQAEQQTRVQTSDLARTVLTTCCPPLHASPLCTLSVGGSPQPRYTHTHHHTQPVCGRLQRVANNCRPLAFRVRPEHATASCKQQPSHNKEAYCMP